MGLYPDDKLPQSLIAKEAYSAIHDWYNSALTEGGKFNVHKVFESRDDAMKRVRLIKALPHPNSVTAVEIKAVFLEVVTGILEFAYHADDGSYKMAAYAKVGLGQFEGKIRLEPEETKTLRTSRLWPFISRERYE